MAWVVAACLAYWPTWEPVEALLARADTIVEAEIAADGQFVVKASLKGANPPPARAGRAGRALLFFSEGFEISRWQLLESGEFDLPDHLLVPNDWSTTSVSRDRIEKLLARTPLQGVAGWTVNDQACVPCKVRDAFVERAFSEGEHVICLRDGGADCIEQVRDAGGWGATKPLNDSFVFVMDGGVEVISIDRQRDRPSLCGGARLVSTRCEQLSASGCLAPREVRVLCEEIRAARQVPMTDVRVRCLGAYLAVERYHEVGSLFSCGPDTGGVAPQELWPHGRCFRERFDLLGSMRCEALNPDGGSAGWVRRGVFE